LVHTAKSASEQSPDVLEKLAAGKLDYFDPEYGSGKVLRNVGNYFLIDISLSQKT
jgi:hypothetical protein